MNQKIFADLHNHTVASDGDFSSEKIIEQAKDKGIRAVAITDHDTLGGLAAGLEAGKRLGVQVIPGVEVSIRFKEPGFTGTLHLLCYFKAERLADEAFVARMTSVLASGRGEKLVRARVDEINRWFGPNGKEPKLKEMLTYDHIARLSQNASRRHFAIALSESFGITDREEANGIIGNDSPAYLPSGIDFADAMSLAGELGLLSVLAHPAAGSFPGEGHYKEVLPPVETVAGILPRFLENGLKGVEVYYPGHTPELEAQVLSWANAHNLVVTGGSDCHDEKGRPFGLTGIGEADFIRFQKAL